MRQDPTLKHQLPREAFQVARAYNLGQPLKIYRPPLRNVLVLLILGPGIVIYSIFLCIQGVSTNPYWWGSLNTICGLPLICLTGVFLALFGLAILGQRRLGTNERFNKRAYEYTKGFAMLKGRGEGYVTDVTRWDQVEEVYHGIECSGEQQDCHHTFWVIRKDGTKQDISYPKLWKRIEEEYTQRHLQRALESYHAGRPVIFGKLSVSVHTVDLTITPSDQKTLAWNDIARVHVKDDALVIKGREEAGSAQLSVPVSQIPNTCLLERLLHEVSGGCIECTGLHLK
ncbi:hypothetical protein KSF_027900 [Reticulibacter mediterranei]|uniref:Uncharacterized protein n=1 Tax=Reticulibacter mediterranei TaxID=2778369 RepID=A0A8J3IK34_9CHLR|nr:DCL family protein [Reticulibacter mediterranei]GHO92742.1 hypothetical protein KSF_027900 [Reticulibacter mediterranei]